MNKLNCNIVLDLLPSYIENLTNNETNTEIREHLCGCRSCSKIYSDMTDGESHSETKEIKEINYLKKLKSRNYKIITVISAALLLSALIALACYGHFGISTQGYSVEYININPYNNILSVDISLNYSNYAITSVSAEENADTVVLNVRSTAPVFKKDSTCEFRYHLNNESIVRVMTSNGQILWENDEDIPKKVNDIYKARAKDIGNSQVTELLEAIDLHSELRCESYAVHHIADKKPYGLEIYDITSYDDMFSSFSNESYEQRITGCAYIILACIENLDFVKFDYVTPSGKEKTYTLTVDEANYSLGIANKNTDGNAPDSIKQWSESCSSLKILMFTIEQRLSDKNDLKFSPYFEGTTGETAELLSFTPIDEKYSHILNTEISDLISECENEYEWGKAYEKQYKIIYKALLDYAEKNPELDDYIRNDLVKSLKSTQDYYEYNDKMTDLYHNVEKISSANEYRDYLNSRRFFRESREKTLRLAECAYLLNIEFEWIA